MRRPSIVAVVLTAGRDEYLARTLASFEEMVGGNIERRIIFDDTGDREHRADLEAKHSRYEVLPATLEGRNHPAAIDAVFATLALYQQDYVFWLEEDFTFNHSVDLDDLAATMDAEPNLCQLQLLRQPWFKGELAAGGVIERDPDAYTRVASPHGDRVEHRLWWTWNPSLFRREEIVDRDYPRSGRHEWDFGRALLSEDPERFFAFAGDGSPWVTHIGEVRA